jgi:hypothetical protein
MSNDQFNQLPAASCIVVDNDRLMRIERDLREIRAALVGNPEMGVKGIVHRTESIERTVAQIQKERGEEAATRRGAVWVISVAAATAGAIGGLVARIFTHPA